MRDAPSHPSSDTDRPPRALTALILDVFRLNGDLLAAGDALVGELGLSSARWQVLGAIALSPVALPVAHIARTMGLARQSVQRVVGEMSAEGLLRYAPNPHHRRAMLVTMTETGEQAYRAASMRQERWAGNLAKGLTAEEIEAATGVLRTLRRRLDTAAGAARDAPTPDDTTQKPGSPT